MGVSHDRLVVVDWKGFALVERASVNAQLHLAALGFARMFGRTECDVAIVDEARPMDVAYLDALDLEAFAIEVKQIVETTRTSTVLVEGEHCRWCPAFLAGCPLKRKLADEAASGELMRRAEALIPFATDADATRAYELAANVRTFLKRLDAALCARAKEAPIPLADGKVFGPHVKRGDETIDAAVAYDVIRAERGDETARAAVEWSTTKAQIKRALEIVVGKGGVAAAERKTLAEIRARAARRAGRTARSSRSTRRRRNSRRSAMSDVTEIQRLDGLLAAARAEIDKLTAERDHMRPVYVASLAWADVRRRYESHPDETELRRKLYVAIDKATE